MFEQNYTKYLIFLAYQIENKIKCIICTTYQEIVGSRDGIFAGFEVQMNTFVENIKKTCSILLVG